MFWFLNKKYFRKNLKSVYLISFLLFSLTGESAAQYYFFGRNKVQWENFEWKILKTENFDIYYYGKMDEIAGIGAEYAEEIYQELEIKFNHVVSSRIPLIFYNTSLHFQQTNTTPGLIPDGVGGFFEFLKGRVVIPMTGSLNDFRHVIRHELVHVFMTTKIFRIQRDFRLSYDLFPPLWFTEGLAEFLSTEIDAQAEMVMRDAVIQNYLFPIEDIYQISGSFLMYKEGQSFLEFVSDYYGQEKVMLFLDNFWMYSDFERVIEHTIGKPLKEIDKDWIFYLKRKYYPLLKEKAPPDNASKKLTNFGFNFSPVKVTIDSVDYLYFVANRDGYSSIYRLPYRDNNYEYPEPELVLRGEKSEELEAFHLFQSAIDVYNDSLLVFVSKAGRSDVIHFYDVVEEEIINTFKDENLVSISSPVFSPGGNRIVFSAVDQKGFSDLYIYNTSSGKLERLTNDYYDDRDPVFDEANNRIVFVSDRTTGEFEKNYNLFSYNLSDHHISYLLYAGFNITSPFLSPDGKKIFFTADYDGVRNIWSIRNELSEQTTELTQQTHFLTSAFYPVFTDSAKIVFSGFENFSFNLYEKNLEQPSDTNLVTLVVAKKPVEKEPWIPAKIIIPPQEEELYYQKDYTLDYAQSQIVTDPIYGTRGGAVLSLSDLLGDDRFDFLIYNTAQVQSEFLRSFNLVIQRINLADRANHGYGIFHFSGRRYDIRDSDEFFFERSFGGFFLLNFPLSKFQRIEASVTLANSDKEVIEGVIERKALLLSNSLSWILDNSLWGPSGPLDGIRARILVGYTGDVKFSNVNYFTLIADYRHYLRLGFMSALAFRSALFYNEGKEARRYFMGGSWDLRGWPRWSIRGEKLWISSLELRFPLINQIYLRLPVFNLSLPGVRGALFFDAGSAWDEKYRETLGSLGWGFRINLFGALVLRYDIGKRIEQDFSRFQTGLFYQFFFGWDF